MSEVARVGANELGTLADKINAEHRACQAAANTALEHAMNAGDLLLEVRAECPHGTWQDWVDDNFEGSLRTSQIYMYLARRREEVGEIKAQSSALLSIAEALHKLALRHVSLLPAPPELQQVAQPVAEQPEGQPTEQPPLEDPRPSEDGHQAQDRARRISYVEDVVRAQAKKGDPNPPPSMAVEVSAEEWRKLYAREVKARTQQAADKMIPLIVYLEKFMAAEQDGYRPEEAGVGVTRLNHQDQAVAVLRNSIAWLQRVIDEAEQEQARMQDAE